MFNLSSQNIEHLAIARFPNLTVTSSALRVGRVTVPRKSQLKNSSNTRPFYLTKQVLTFNEFCFKSKIISI